MSLPTRTEPSLDPASVGTITTAIHIPKTTWNLLRAVAFHRAQSRGGRASVSKLLTELIEERRKSLESEVNG